MLSLNERKEKIMTQKEHWKHFYNTVGGEYICEECGNILTSAQYKAIRETSGNNWLLIIILSIILTPLFAIIHLAFFGVKKRCPVCRTKTKRTLPLNSIEGIRVFKEKHPEYINLLDNLSVGKK